LQQLGGPLDGLGTNGSGNIVDGPLLPSRVHLTHAADVERGRFMRLA